MRKTTTTAHSLHSPPLQYCLLLFPPLWAPPPRSPPSLLVSPPQTPTAASSDLQTAVSKFFFWPEGDWALVSIGNSQAQSRSELQQRWRTHQWAELRGQMALSTAPQSHVQNIFGFHSKHFCERGGPWTRGTKNLSSPCFLQQMISMWTNG